MGLETDRKFKIKALIEFKIDIKINKRCWKWYISRLFIKRI